jgi:hypothetical protein
MADRVETVRALEVAEADPAATIAVRDDTLAALVALYDAIVTALASTESRPLEQVRVALNTALTTLRATAS